MDLIFSVRECCQGAREMNGGCGWKILCQPAEVFAVGW